MCRRNELIMLLQLEIFKVSSNNEEALALDDLDYTMAKTNNIDQTHRDQILQWIHFRGGSSNLWCYSELDLVREIVGSRK